MSISNDDFESFRQSVNGVYCRGEKMTVKGEKHTSDPRKYKQWLMDEKQKQRENHSMPRGAVPTEAKAAQVFKQYGDKIIDTAAITHVTVKQESTTVHLVGGGTVEVSRKDADRLVEDLKVKERP